MWSKGVNYAKDGTFYLESESEEEIQIRYHRPPVSPRITLWPSEEDWHCDCGDRNDPCAHVIGAFLAYKDGKTKHPDKPSIHVDSSARLEYRFFPYGGFLYFERFLVSGKSSEKLNNQSLFSLVGGSQSGRVAKKTPLAGKEDYAIDNVLGGAYQNPLDRYTLTRLLAAMQGTSRVFYCDEATEISAQTVSPQVRVYDDGEEVVVDWAGDATVSQWFKNGAALCGNVIKAVREPALSSKEREAFRRYKKNEYARLSSEILPHLESKLVINVQTKRLPRIAKYEPRIVLHMQAESARKLSVYPSLFYGDPPVAEVVGGKLEPLESHEVPERQIEAEEVLRKKLHQELQLQLGRQSVFEDESALLFISKAKSWPNTGNGLTVFTVQGELTPEISWQKEDLNVGFHLPDSAGTVSAESVLLSWKENRSFVPLDGGGWAALPHEWLLKYADRIEAVLSAKNTKNKIPRHFIPDLAGLCEEEGYTIPEQIRSLLKQLKGDQPLPKPVFPDDLKADLRSYQHKGIEWLLFLRAANLGAMLADDMGLGKTLQSIACIEGKTLVVCPTSVLQSWCDQIQQFRPSLKVNLYYGTNRSLKDGITLTSYGILRLDQDILADKEWDTIILDETQVIKNPDSQIAKAAHRLFGKFKVALSGTPIENRLDDLWSQFQFLNPGLLWSRSEFTERFGDAIRSGNPRKLDKLRERIRPFLLRRKKTEVAPELPPRTEVVLHCDLSDEERNIYKAIVAASKKEVIEKLETSGNVMAALEMLLRLRQVSCHAALVPGSGVSTDAASAKTELLMESLEESLSLGHRCLLFSQWTSLLDIVEKKVQAAGITFSRLDGSTRNRSEVVAEFQKESGPQIMLLSLKAGGVGITLTAADHIYILDPWWNPAAEDQAADRAHRIGQVNPVIIHRLVARETVEDKILSLQKSKRALAEGVVSGSGTAADISKQELMHILETI